MRHTSILFAALVAVLILSGVAAADVVPPQAPVMSGYSMSFSTRSCSVSWVAPTLDEGGGALTGLAGYRVYRSVDSGTITLLCDTVETSFTDTMAGYGVNWYMVSAYDAEATPNESARSDTVGGRFRETSGAVRIYVSDQGDGRDPLTASPTGAVPTINDAMRILDSSNGYDTVVVYRQKNADSYGAVGGGANAMGQGLFLLSYKYVYGTDDGGGGDTWPLVSGIATASYATIGGFSVNFARTGAYGVVLASQSVTLDSLALTGDAAASCIVTGNAYDAVVRNVSMYNCVYGLQQTGGTVTRLTMSNCSVDSASGYGAYASYGGYNSYVNCRFARTTHGVYLESHDKVVGCVFDVEGYALYFNTVSIGCVITGNEIVHSAASSYDIHVGSLTEGALFSYNNFVGVKVYSTAYSTPINVLEHNYWGVTDSLSVAALMTFTDDAMYIPDFRMGLVDTAPGADTVAPRPPDAVVLSTVGGCSLSWAAPTKNEDSSALSDLSFYRIYRSDSHDLTGFACVGETTSTSFADTTAVPGDFYYYKVTAVDAKTPLRNESFFSAMVGGSSFVDPGNATVFVSDQGDGSDPSGGVPAGACRTMADALAILNSGNGYDTVVVFRETGTMYDRVSMPLYGQRGLTVVSYRYAYGSDTGGGGNGRPTLFGLTLGDSAIVRDLTFQVHNTSSYGGLHASDASNIDVRDIYLWGYPAYRGTMFTRVNGLVLRNCLIEATNTCVALASCTNVVIDSVTMRQFVDYGGGGPSSDCNMTVEGVNALTVVNSRFVSAGTYDIYFLTRSCSDVVLRHNFFNNTASYSFSTVQAMSGLVVEQNDFRGAGLNGGLYFAAQPISYSIRKNNFLTAWSANSCGAPVDLTMNYWGNPDSTVVEQKRYGVHALMTDVLPCLTSMVDTSAGSADTVAPAAPTGVSVTGPGATPTVSWAAVTSSYEPEAATNVAGYHVWRVSVTDPEDSVGQMVGTTDAATLSWTDPANPKPLLYWYRVTAFDDHPAFPNESPFSAAVGGNFNTLVINEYIPNPTAIDHDNDGVLTNNDEEYIELYNDSVDTLSVGGWDIGDESTLGKWTLSGSTYIPPYGFLLLYPATDPAGDRLYLYDRFGNLELKGTFTGVASGLLNNSAPFDTIYVRDAGDNLVTKATYPSVTANQAWANEWDGLLAEPNVKFAQLTPGRPNGSFGLSVDTNTVLPGETFSVYVTCLRPDGAQLGAMGWQSTDSLAVSVSGGTALPAALSFSGGVASCSMSLSGTLGAVTVTVRRGAVSGTVAVTVSGAPPSITSPPSTLWVRSEDTRQVTLAATDDITPQGALIWTVTDSGMLSASVAGGMLSIWPNGLSSGQSDTVTVRVTDGDGLSSVRPVSVSVSYSGDVTCDGAVDFEDASALGAGYGSVYGDADLRRMRAQFSSPRL